MMDQLEIVEIVFTDKYFVNNVKGSLYRGGIIRKLTDKEFEIYNAGDNIGDIIKVFGCGYRVLRNPETQEEFKVEYMKI